MSKSLDPDQAGPDLVPNCLQKLSAEDTSRQRVNYGITSTLTLSICGFGHVASLSNQSAALQSV